MAALTEPMTERTFVDAKGVTIHYYTWAAPKPKGVVQLVHGLGEYAARYTALAQELVAAGYSVYADDHRGHGRTGVEQHLGNLKQLGKLGPGGLRATIEEVRQLTTIIRSENAGVPVAILGPFQLHDHGRAQSAGGPEL